VGQLATSLDHTATLNISTFVEINKPPSLVTGFVPLFSSLCTNLLS